tara:strand:+ start:1902 stop:2315 length:414 start_codon:yes stop_codon:yes gene_type:complete
MNTTKDCQRAYLLQLATEGRFNNKWINWNTDNYDELACSHNWEAYKKSYFIICFEDRRRLYTPGKLMGYAKTLIENLLQYELLDVNDICVGEHWELHQQEYEDLVKQREMFSRYGTYSQRPSTVSKNFYKHWCENKK